MGRKEITKKSSCLDHKTLSDIKQQHSFGESYCFLHCKVSKLKSHLVARGTVTLPPPPFNLYQQSCFLFFVSRLGFASYIPSGICVLFPVSGCFLVDQ
uniref:Uncharacterized protein n=1 Tax=Sciurus vulgaris TaxID=55149 RepID=A0A8D2B910_SCIVU